MAGQITIRKAVGTWVVRAGGAVLGETTNALELTEGARAPVIYFPPADLAMAFFEKTARTSHCPGKGDASYFSIHTKSRELQNAAWSYETPVSEVQDIAGHLAFYLDEVAVEKL